MVFHVVPSEISTVARTKKKYALLSQTTFLFSLLESLGVFHRHPFGAELNWFMVLSSLSDYSFKF